MAYIDIAEKLKYVLYKFSNCSYKFCHSDDVYLQKLIHFLGSRDVKSASHHVLVKLPLCKEWLQHVAGVWENAPPHPSVAWFALRLAALTVVESREFEALQSAGTLDRLLSSLAVEIGRSGSVTMAYITLLTEILEHVEGCSWVMQMDVWQRVAGLSVESSCVQVVRAAHKFVSNLVVKLKASEDCHGCKTVLGDVMGRLQLAQSKTLKDNSDKDVVMSSSALLCSVLEAALSQTGVAVTAILLKDHDLESLMWHFIKLLDDEAYIGRLFKVLLLLYFTLFKKTSDTVPSMMRTVCFKTKFFGIITYLSEKYHVKTILYVCFECQVYFHKFGMKNVKFEETCKTYDLRDQLLLFQIMPILCYQKKYNTTRDEYLLDYIQKLYHLTCEETIRLAYALKDFLMSDISCVREPSKCALIYLQQMKTCLSKEQVATVCQALIHTLKTMVLSYTEDFVVHLCDIVSMVLDVLSTLVDHFHISLHECVDCVGVFSFAEMLLQNSFLPSTVSVKALRLMQVAVRNYLPPNLALLVNTVEGSAIKELGPLLHRRLHDVSWDVRDSALELLHTVVDISHVNFPAFQQHILENDLCMMTLVLAMDDAESYVRASALKCLASMQKNRRYWEECLCSQHLPNKLMYILNVESEGIVRKEAAMLMKELYHHHNIQKSIEGEVLSAMASAACNDLYWEVKLNALCFWEKVIEQQLSHQGMIDGRFPAVTFSRENRKIVTLTEDEVRSRINKALEELGRLGCLQVLLSAVDDCDLQVAYKAVAVTTSLSTLLLQYNILPTPSTTTCVDTSTPMLEDKTQQKGDIQASVDSDQVIENIINQSDTSLLSQTYRRRSSISEACPSSVLRPMKAKDFLCALTSLNLQDLVSQRAQWIDSSSDSLDCLLDDILFTHGDPDNVVSDCY